MKNKEYSLLVNGYPEDEEGMTEDEIQDLIDQNEWDTGKDERYGLI